MFLTNFFTKVAFVGILLFPTLCTAQDVATDPVTELKLRTWIPTPEVVTDMLSAMTDHESLIKSFDESLDNGFARMKWSGCEMFFGDEGEACTYNGTGEKLFKQVHRHVLESEFISSLTDEQKALLANTATTTVGEGRAKLALEEVQLVYLKPFDVSKGLDYQRWRGDWCNFHFIPSDVSVEFREQNEKTRSKTDCLNDPFVVFLQETYCLPDRECDLARVSWTYGFLVRRYMRGGDDAVLTWQQLMQEAAEVVDVQLSGEVN
jgi:hypothetical protein